MQTAWIYILILFVTGIISFSLSFLVRKYALSHKLVQSIRSRDVHKKPIPRFGGVAIFLGFWLTAIGVMVFMPGGLNFIETKVWNIDKNLLGVFLGAIIIAIVMLIDDIKGLNWSWKLASQFAAAIVVALFGVTISWFNAPLHLQLGEQAFQIGSLAISWGQIFVVFWIVLIMNVVNWLDGLDGLAGGVVMISGLAIFLLSISPRINQPATAILAILLVGSILGFMPYNFHPAKMFLGDTGSMFIGYMLAILAIISGGKVATASLVMGIPLLDGIWVITSRILHHHSPFQADQNHIHHRLMKAGFSIKQTVVILYSISIVFGYLALRSGREGKFWAMIWLIGVMIFLSLALLVLQWIRRNKHSEG